MRCCSSFFHAGVVPAGSTNLKCLDCNLRNASMANASWASVSKHAMHTCACLISASQNLRTSVMVQVSENQRTAWMC